MIRFGVATAALQIEGATDADGRGPSTWDEFWTRPGAILDGSDATVACDSYRRVEEDLRLLADLGVDAYRFSISWPRVQPTGSGAVNRPGLDYYDRLVDGLLAIGVDPCPTLFHWDLPLALEVAGGWPERDTAERFADYCAVVAERLGDRVRVWATLNEPWCTAMLGYAAGVFAPGVRDPLRAHDAAHHLLLGHALAADAVRAAAPWAEVGIVLNLTVVRLEPDGDPAAADVVDAWQNRLWLDALLDGRSPDALGPAPAQREGDLERIRGSADWVGVNYYTPFRIGAAAESAAAVGQDTSAYPSAPPFAFAPRPPLTTMGWEVDPSGLVELLRDLARRAPGMPLRITENGIALPDHDLDDQERIGYLDAHISAAETARAEGVDVRDYFAWSLLDNFEWAQGYTQTFGLVAMEPQTLRRLPKASFSWYAARIAASRG